ncbi:MAG: dTDP-4-dehydrorhamnose reductase [Selenomonadaceae bacterium]|nr:dTDP-4-dehydrorhamnose reductase [Selenomonadaceae bacterium]
MILVTGITGQLGADVVKELERRGENFIGTTRKELDLSNPEEVKNFIIEKKPDAVIHCAAYTAVDKAESEAELALTVNGLSTRKIAEACREIGAKMLYISTDYVFGGDGETPYEISDEKAPQNIYGKSKLLGEDSVIALLRNYFIVRISWVFGAGGKNFVKTMLNFDKRRKKISVVDDQIGSPTYTADLAPLLVDMINSDKYGIYHATNEGFCSWAELAEEIFKQAGREITVEKIPTSDYPTPAKRPFNSRLSKKSLDEAGFNRLPSWQDAVTRFLTEIGGIKNAGNKK